MSRVGASLRGELNRGITLSKPDKVSTIMIAFATAILFRKPKEQTLSGKRNSFFINKYLRFPGTLNLALVVYDKHIKQRKYIHILCNTRASQS